MHRPSFQCQLTGDECNADGLSEMVTCLDKAVDAAKVTLGIQHQEENVPPFAVICGAPSSGLGRDKDQRTRTYEWGSCNTDDPDHSDFLLIKYARQLIDAEASWNGYAGVAARAAEWQN